ncbi:unnamed protein product [Effrenium voratum]|nr:unnamed protein product [Effrenium voratum]
MGRLYLARIMQRPWRPGCGWRPSWCRKALRRRRRALRLGGGAELWGGARGGVAGAGGGPGGNGPLRVRGAGLAPPAAGPSAETTAPGGFAEQLAEMLLLQHGETMLRNQRCGLPAEEMSLLMEAQRLFRWTVEEGSSNKCREGLAQVLLQLALAGDCSLLWEAEQLLRDSIEKGADSLARQASLAFCLQLQGRDNEAVTLFHEVLPAFCRWAEEATKAQAPSPPLRLGATVLGAISAAYNCAALDGDVTKLRWALALAETGSPSNCMIAERLAELEGTKAEDETSEAPNSQAEPFLALWPRRSPRKAPGAPRKAPRGLCCCLSARHGSCVAVGH